MSEFLLYGFGDAVIESKLASWSTNKIGGKAVSISQTLGFKYVFFLYSFVNMIFLCLLKLVFFIYSVL